MIWRYGNLAKMAMASAALSGNIGRCFRVGGTRARWLWHQRWHGMV
jgi:hypothetical protein